MESLLLKLAPFRYFLYSTDFAQSLLHIRPQLYSALSFYVFHRPDSLLHIQAPICAFLAFHRLYSHLQQSYLSTQAPFYSSMPSTDLALILNVQPFLCMQTLFSSSFAFHRPCSHSQQSLLHIRV